MAIALKTKRIEKEFFEEEDELEEDEDFEEDELEEEETVEEGGKLILAFIERLERLSDDREAINQDMKEVMAEAKGRGLDIKTLRTLLKLRKMDREKREMEEDLLMTYRKAIGLV